MDDFLEFPLAFIDIETTDNKVSTARIVELAIVKLKNDMTPGETYRSYFNPTVPMTPEAAEVTKLTDDFLQKYATFKEAAPTIMEFIKDCDIAGHNIMAFDIPVLVEEFHRAGITDFPRYGIKYIDTRVLQIKIMPTTLAAVYKFYTNNELDPDNAHGAEFDALASASVYKHQIERYGSLLGDSREDLHNVSTYGKVIVDFAGKIAINDNHKMIYNFGKSVGKLITADLDYAKWMLDKGDFTMDTKRWIKHALKYDNEFYVSDKLREKIEANAAESGQGPGLINPQQPNIDWGVWDMTSKPVKTIPGSVMEPEKPVVVNNGVPDELFPPK